MLEINGVKLDFDLMNAEIAEAAEKALDNFTEKHKNLEKVRGLGAAIREECDLVYDFFNEAFGEGAAEEIFQGEKHYLKCCDAFKKVVDEIKKFNEILSERNQEMKGLAEVAADGQVKRFEKK